MATTSSSPQPQQDGGNSELRVEPIDSPEDLTLAFDCVSEAFGRQARDGIWAAMNPGWETPGGRALGAARLTARWRTVTRDSQGNPSTVFLKATAPDAQNETKEIIVGFAIWVQTSAVPGHGEPPTEDFIKALDLESLYPGDSAEQRYIDQVFTSLTRRRREVIREKTTATPPSVFALDMCAVDPRFQRKGVATKLVQWGLDEARRRGNLEAVTEGSVMGRHVYARMGFRQEGSEIEYLVDEKYADRQRPSNVFMRTGEL